MGLLYLTITNSITFPPCLQKSIPAELINFQFVKDIPRPVTNPEVFSRVHRNSLLADTQNYMDPVTVP
jgi:hypothetical protein